MLRPLLYELKTIGSSPVYGSNSVTYVPYWTLPFPLYQSGMMIDL